MNVKPGVQALRDQLLVAVRALGSGTTHQVIAAVFTDGKARPARNFTRVYAQLRALEHLGLVTREMAGNHAIWSPGPQLQPPPDGIDDLWSVS